MAKKKKPDNGLIAENRKARYNYAIEDTLEAGLALTGPEVKSLRVGQANIAESYASPEQGEMWLINSYIAAYDNARMFEADERRKRKLLLKRREIARLRDSVAREGITVVPLKLYFNEDGRAKLLLGIAKGKKAQDKREDSKKRDWNRQKSRLLKRFED